MPTTRRRAVVILGLVYILFAVVVITKGSYAYIRYRTDEPYRNRLIDEMSAKAKEDYIQQQGGRAVLLPDAIDQIVVDHQKVEAVLRHGITKGFVIGWIFALLAIPAGAIISLQCRWCRWIGLIAGAVFCFLSVSMMLSSHTPKTLWDWSGVLFFIGLGIITILVFRRKLEASDDGPVSTKSG